MSRQNSSLYSISISSLHKGAINEAGDSGSMSVTGIRGFIQVTKRDEIHSAAHYQNAYRPVFIGMSPE